MLAGSRLISQNVDGTSSYYLQDALGSTRALVDVTGSVTDTYDYSAFGELYAQTGTTINPYLYTGQRYDATTEQYYLRAREYDPAVGRFLSQDTRALDAWNPVEVNRYVYAAANPIIYGDPTGLAVITVPYAKQISFEGLKNIAITTVLAGALTCVVSSVVLTMLMTQVLGPDLGWLDVIPDKCKPNQMRVQIQEGSLHNYSVF